MGERAQAGVAERVGHTPGPWKRMRGSQWGPDIPYATPYCTWINLGPSDDRAPVAIILTDEDDERTPILSANANLIAAAPDMLAALREAAMCVPPGTQLCNQINAAIAKAEGR